MHGGASNWDDSSNKLKMVLIFLSVVMLLVVGRCQGGAQCSASGPDDSEELHLRLSQLEKQILKLNDHKIAQQNMVSQLMVDNVMLKQHMGESKEAWTHCKFDEDFVHRYQINKQDTNFTK